MGSGDLLVVVPLLVALLVTFLDSIQEITCSSRCLGNFLG